MRIKSFMQKFARDERGVSALEYAVLAAVIVVAVVAFSDKLQGLYSTVFSNMESTVTDATKPKH